MDLYALEHHSTVFTGDWEGLGGLPEAEARQIYSDSESR